MDKRADYLDLRAAGALFFTHKAPDTCYRKGTSRLDTEDELRIITKHMIGRQRLGN